MFSFHKPRVYRSTEGCCICRAKSSSSRFTDSKKYEDDSVKCFNLEKPRQGEICNACVLLVKRFKRLPIGSNRHWGHVVDARIGPGMKSISKFKKLKEECQQQQRQSASENRALGSRMSAVSEKFCKIFRKNKKKIMEKKKFAAKPVDNSSDENSSPATPESLNSDEEGTYRSRRRRLSGIRRRKCRKPRKFSKRNLENVGFFDEKDWTSRWSCCGAVFENNKIGALIVDLTKSKPCPEHVEFFKSAFNEPRYQDDKENSNEKTERIIPFAQTNNLTTTQNMLSCNSSKANKFATENNEVTLALNGNNASKNNFALKKHQLYCKRQNESFQNEPPSTAHETPESTEGTTANSQVANQNEQMAMPAIKSKHAFLQKIKSDTSKMVKNSIEKIAGSSKPKSAEPNEVKDPKQCIASGSTGLKGPTQADGSSANKYSDNSSDSGFEENVIDPSLLNLDGNQRKIIIRPIESLFLSTTIPITIPAPPGSHKPPTQIHKTINTPHNMAVLNSHKIRAIFNATADGGITCLKAPASALTSNGSAPTSPSGSTTAHKKFLYVKGKNIETSNN